MFNPNKDKMKFLLGTPLKLYQKCDLKISFHDQKSGNGLE